VAEQVCRALRRDGLACRAPARSAAGYCLSHDPERIEQLHDARSRGAVSAGRLRALKGRRRKLESAGALTKFMGGLIQDILDQSVDVDTARAVTYAVAVQRQLIERSDLEQRIARIEREQAQDRSRRWG
jgi:hypothetical protein